MINILLEHIYFKTFVMVLKKLANWTRSKITEADSYASTVHLTFNGKKEFCTFYGGVVSLMIKTVIIMYAVLLTIRIFRKSDSEKLASTMVRDLTYDDEKHYIGKGNFAFAVRLTGSNPELLLDTSYFTFTVNNANYLKDSNFQVKKISTPIEMES